MEERVEISLMLDLYGNLLTEKQKEIMTLYYDEDLSLAEISEIANTSRQAIHDILRRCHKILLEYEKKLHLLQKSLDYDANKKYILEKINLLKEKLQNNDVLEIVSEIEKRV